MSHALPRREHIELAREANQRGELLLADAMSDPADSALLIFRALGIRQQTRRVLRMLGNTKRERSVQSLFISYAIF